MIDRRRAAEKAEGSEIEAPDLEWRDPSAGPGPGGVHLAALFSLETGEPPVTGGLGQWPMET